MKKQNNPLVSFVICEHNTPVEYFNDAIKSVINQTYKNLEIIIVNDCSNIDLDSLGVINFDKRIRIYNNARNLGLAASRNVGISHANGKYIAIMDTDDICFPNRIEEQVKYLEKHKDVICAGSYVQLFGKRNLIQKNKIKNNEYYRCCLFFNNSPTITNPSVLIRKEALDIHRIKYDERLYSAEDYMMWIRLSDVGKVTIIKKTLLKYRIRDGQMSEIYRTDGLGDNGKTIRRYQLEKIGAINSLTDEELGIIESNYRSEKVLPISYFNILMKIKKTNLKSLYYNPKTFSKRIRQQWKMKIYSIKNFQIFKTLIKSLPFFEKIYALLVEIFRPLNIFKRLFSK